MYISGKENDMYLIDIHYNDLTTQINYSLSKKDLIFLYNDELSVLLKKNAYQLKKILRNKRKDTFYEGFTLKFVLRNNDDVILFNDLTKIVVFDNRNENSKVYTVENYECDFIRLYTDGAYSEKKGISSYVALSKSSVGLYDIIYGIKEVRNSSLIELIAVIEALKKYSNEDRIRITTDSRYVIKGVTEWICNWRLNNWYTAQGEQVKHIEYWKEYESLCSGKYIEYQWVKGHSFHFENTVCDKYATELLKRSQ